MPLTYTRTFRVRFYECDAKGHLNSAYYLRYMQETAFDASAAAGYDMARYDQMQRHWLIRESQVEYLLPLRYNQRVAVTTWIADFRRVTSRRAYEFRLAETGELAARAFTDWVFLDTANNRPSSIPQSLVDDFFPEGTPAHFPARKPFPNSSPPPGMFCMHRRVAWQDIDAMQHVNNAVYMEYINECGFQVCAAFHRPGSACGTGFCHLLRQARLHTNLRFWTTSSRSLPGSRVYTGQAPDVTTPFTALATAFCWPRPIPWECGSTRTPSNRSASRRRCWMTLPLTLCPGIKDVR
jgi:acyl-CoA thioester hydrolase